MFIHRKKKMYIVERVEEKVVFEVNGDIDNEPKGAKATPSEQKSRRYNRQ